MQVASPLHLAILLLFSRLRRQPHTILLFIRGPIAPFITMPLASRPPTPLPILLVLKRLGTAIILLRQQNIGIIHLLKHIQRLASLLRHHKIVPLLLHIFFGAFKFL